MMILEGYWQGFSRREGCAVRIEILPGCGWLRSVRSAKRRRKWEELAAGSTSPIDGKALMTVPAAAHRHCASVRSFGNSLQLSAGSVFCR